MLSINNRENKLGLGIRAITIRVPSHTYVQARRQLKRCVRSRTSSGWRRAAHQNSRTLQPGRERSASHGQPLPTDICMCAVAGNNNTETVASSADNHKTGILYSFIRA